MLVNVSFDEMNKDIDIIDIPENIYYDIENVQTKFFEWLFDTNNNHEYWIYENNQKKYCSYRADAFVYWLNKYFIMDEGKIVQVVKKFECDVIQGSPIITF